MVADLSFLLPFSPPGEDSDQFNVGGMRSVGVAPRPMGKSFDTAGVFGDFCRLLYQAGFMPVLIPMDRKEDLPVIEEISKRQGGRIPDLRKAVTPMQIQQRVDRMDAVVAMRLHAGILAAGVCVPPLMVSYDPKVASFARLLEVGPAVSLDGLTPTRLLDMFTSFHKDHDRNVKILERKRQEMYSLAQGNINVLYETIGMAAKM
jgi:polysaccharide pyruvyl transferase WcaK-like protein